MSYVARNHPQQVEKRGPLVHVDDRATTPEMFAALHERFRFTIDVAASDENAKLPVYITRGLDGLIQWWAAERVWCNPPHSDMSAWVAKAWKEWEAVAPAELIVMLAPANRTEQGWWQDMVEPYRDRDAGLRVEFLRGRTRFIAPGAFGIRPNERPPYGCCSLIWDRA